MENIKNSYKNNKFEISGPTHNDEFELPDGSYSVSDSQDCFEYVIKSMKHWLMTFQCKYVSTDFKLEWHIELRIH